MEVVSRPVEISIDDQLYDLLIKIIPTLLPAGEKRSLRLELRVLLSLMRKKSNVFRKLKILLMEKVKLIENFEHGVITP